MRLQSLKLAGFKSFANATTFTFAHGITAIVGPNGCGKSNVIDAIRWVLGETSAKQLRGGAMSDVIFAGTQEKSAKSMASVELTFEHTQDEQTGIRHEFNLYHELSVRRQVNKEGRSDYFINGTRCRRRDVIDVFLGTGLGARSYAVIEQGMIGRIVESNPMQLREFIEEAAGVSRYQARREETQKRLSVTQDNLARLQDMQSELVRQQKSLARQATSAQRYQELVEALAKVKQQLAVQQLYQAKQAQQQQKKTYEDSVIETTTCKTKYEQLKAVQDKLNAQISQEQWLKDNAQSAHYEQQLEFKQAEYQLRETESKLTDIERQLATLAQQRAQALVEIERLRAEEATQQLALNTQQPKLDVLTHKRDSYKDSEQPLQRAWHDTQHQLTLLQDSERQLEQRQALSKQAQQRHQSSQDKWAQRQQHWQILWQRLQLSEPDTDIEKEVEKCSKQDSHQDKKPTLSIEGLKQQLQQIERQQQSVTEQVEILKPQANTLQQRLTKQLHEVTVQEKQHALLAGEYDTLHQILNPKPIKKSQADRHASDANNLTNSLDDETASSISKPLPMSTLREQIELSVEGQKHAQLLDSLLALWLDSNVLITDQQHSDGIEAKEQHSRHLDHTLHRNLSQNIKGYLPDLLSYQHCSVANTHSLWLPVQSRTSANDISLNNMPAAFTSNVLPLSNLIIKPALALWEQCYLYIDSNKTYDEKRIELTEIVKALPASAWLLTVDGWLISSKGTINLTNFARVQSQQHSDSIANNKQADSHVNSQFLSQRLQQGTRLTQLETLLDDSDDRIQTLSQAVKTSQRDYDALVVHLDESRAQSEQLLREQHQYQQQLTTKQAAVERLQADRQRLEVDKGLLEQEQQELNDEQRVLNDERHYLETELKTLAPKIAATQATRQHLQAERNELSRSRQRDDEAWQALQLLIQKAEIRLEHTSSSLVRASQSSEQWLKNEKALVTNREHYQQQLPSLQMTLQTIEAKRDKQQRLLTQRDAALTAIKQNHSQQQVILDTLQTEHQQHQDKRATLATELALSEVKLVDASDKVRQALAHYQKIIAKNSQQTSQPTISVSSLLTDFITHERRVRPDKIVELQNEQAKLAQQLTKIGAVNLAAVAELNEVNERLQPLAQQTEDIAASMQTLTAAIASIDETTKTLFMQTLAAVNSELSKLFAKVFGGGHASLTLNTDELSADISGARSHSEAWRAGLTLMAQPKGKRNSRLAVLSGGEKTLTALSLIFAIFKQHPAPFCVLDEVDAPLDDANVARFTGLIEELAADLQFIFISHNKLSMQIADELKGITMPTAGISTLVSVSLDEAVHYIES